MVSLTKTLRKFFNCCNRSNVVESNEGLIGESNTSGAAGREPIVVIEISQDNILQDQIHPVLWEDRIKSPIDLHGIDKVDTVVKKPDDVDQSELYPLSWPSIGKGSVAWGGVRDDNATKWEENTKAKDESENLPMPWAGPVGPKQFDGKTSKPSWDQLPVETNMPSKVKREITKDIQIKTSNKEAVSSTTSETKKDDIHVDGDLSASKESETSGGEGIQEVLETKSTETPSKATVTAFKEYIDDKAADKTSTSEKAKMAEKIPIEISDKASTSKMPIIPYRINIDDPAEIDIDTKANIGDLGSIDKKKNALEYVEAARDNEKIEDLASLNNDIIKDFDHAAHEDIESSDKTISHKFDKVEADDTNKIGERTSSRPEESNKNAVTIQGAEKEI